MAKRILIVDDTRQSRELLKDVLQFYGYETIEAGDGAEGVQLALIHRPDLILMDMNMPIMDGYTAMQVLKSDPLTRGIRVAAISSFSLEDEKRNSPEARPDGYIPKPFDIRFLPEIIEGLLSGSE